MAKRPVARSKSNARDRQVSNTNTAEAPPAKRARMGRPKTYDDSQLLSIMAELLAFPPDRGGAVSLADAMRKALSFVPGVEGWPDHIQNQTLDRLKKAYNANRRDLEAVARAQARRFDMPMLPNLLTLPSDPRRLHARREMWSLRKRMEKVAQWAASLSDLLRDRANQGQTVDQNVVLVTHVRELIELVEAEWRKVGWE